MVASARVAYLARRGADYGVHTGLLTVDMTTVHQRKRDMVESFRLGSQSRIESTEGLDLLMGEARFTDRKMLSVRLNDGSARQLRAETIIINAGARPAKPSLFGLDQVPTLDSTSIMELSRVPEHLLVLGGGYIGLEFGQMFRRFGSQVTIIERGPFLLSREDSDVAQEVAKILREDGITLLLETSLLRVKQHTDQIYLTVRGPSGEQTLVGSHMLLATGRTPNTDWLDVAATGLHLDQKGYIAVSDRLETNVPGIYALGDINSGPAFTHISYDDFRILRTNLLEGGHATLKDRQIPCTVFIDPQLGRVGLSETEARKQGRTIRVAKMPMNAVARALEVEESRGFMKAIVDAETNQILGCAVLGIEGGEMMVMIQIAMMGKVPYTTLRDGIFAHPTLAESLNNLFSSFS